MGKKHKPSAPPSPAPPAAKPDVLGQLMKLVAVAVLVVGVIKLALPWLREARLPPAGWVCWSITRSTSADASMADRFKDSGAKDDPVGAEGIAADRCADRRHL